MVTKYLIFCLESFSLYVYLSTHFLVPLASLWETSEGPEVDPLAFIHAVLHSCEKISCDAFNQTGGNSCVL